ncbi:MAG: hypothetical protein IKR61_04300 [Lachnospiraceae bacterium]|nr:hypothetical protein [Lachnospiraceae bacterium]
MQNPKATIKKYCIRGAILLLTVVSILFADRLLCDHTAHGIRQARCIYDQPEDSIDVAMIGSSHIHCDVNTALLWEKYGITAYDYSAAEQPLWITYYYLQELCKHQKPKVVVLDLYGPARFKDDYQYEWLRDNLYGMRFSLTKAKMMTTCIEPVYLDRYFPDFFDYHDRYRDLTAEDWAEALETKDARAAFKGYTPYFKEAQQVEPALEPTLSGGITVKSEIYLQKIIDYTKENGMELFLIVTPYITTEQDEQVYNRVKEIAAAQGVDFNSTNYSYDEMGLDFDSDFNDASHLNYWGSCKFTDYLAGELLDRYALEDHRGDPYYASWDRHAAEIRRQVEDYLNSLNPEDRRERLSRITQLKKPLVSTLAK